MSSGEYQQIVQGLQKDSIGIAYDKPPILDEKQIAYVLGKANQSIHPLPKLNSPQPWISGMSPPGLTFGQPTEVVKTDEEVGQDVLANVEAHHTDILGKLAKAIKEKLQYIDDTASFTGMQWKAFAELSNSIKEMIGK